MSIIEDQTQEAKDRWIQKAKALLFDCTFCVDAKSIKEEINDIIREGGGYDYVTESATTPLRWPTPTPASSSGDPNCSHPEMQFTPGGDHWCPDCHWTDDDDMETS